MNLYEFLNKEIMFLEQKNEHLNILNIGAGGKITNYINNINNSSIINVDINESRNPDFVADACDMKMFGDNSFDSVFLMEVLEHISTPQKALKEIHRVLKPEGRLIVSTPFIFPIHDEPFDFYRYTKFGLEFLLKDFKEVKITRRNDFVHALIVLVARLIVAKPNTDKVIGMALLSLLVILYPVLYMISKLIRTDFATTGYCIVGFK